MSTATPLTSLSAIPGDSQQYIDDGVGSGNKYIFIAEIENVQPLIPIFKAIQIKRDAVMAFTNRGIKITCEDECKTIQANAFIDRSLFQRYELYHPDTPETLCLHMADLMSALSLLFPTRKSNRQGVSNQEEISKLTIKYEKIDHLKLLVQNGNDSIVAEITTFPPPRLEVYSMPFINKIIMDSSLLVDYLRSVDNQSHILELAIDREEQSFDLFTESERALYLYSISPQSTHIEHYECSIPMIHRYELVSFSRSLRSLTISSKVSIRLDAKGFLNMQFVIDFDHSDSEDPSTQQSIQSNAKCFIEYFLVPLEEFFDDE